MDLLINKKYHIYFLLIISAILFFWQIHSIPLTDGDSAFYAKIAKNMVESGNFLTPHYGDDASIVNKPPLMMWMTAVSFKLFGFNDLAASFWHSILALLVVVYTYLLAKEIYNEKTAFISSLILLTSAQFFYQARSPLQDIPLALFILISVYYFVIYLRSRNIGQICLVSLFVSLAVLTKGPVGLALPGLVIFLYLILNRIKFPSLGHIAAALAVFLIVTLPWFIAEYRLLGKAFLDIMVGSSIGRYLKPIDTIGSEAVKYQAIKPQYDFYSYFLQLLLLFIPWSGFVYPAFYYSMRKKINNLPIIFALSILLFFSLSLNYKISRYILPAFPGLAIMIGKMFHDLYQEKDKLAQRMSAIGTWFTLIFIFPLLIAATALLYYNFDKIGAYYLPVMFPLLILLCSAMLIGSILKILKRHKMAFISTITLTFMAYFILLQMLSVYYPKLNPISSFSKKIDDLSMSGDIVCQYKGTDAHFMIYYSKRDVIFLRDENKMLDILRSNKKAYCVTEDPGAFIELQATLKGRIKELDKSANYILFSN